MLKREEYIEFLVGRDGEFDQLVSSTIRRCKRRIRDDNSALIWVMPYPTAEFRDNEDSFRDYYDEIEICEQAATTHYKSAFQIRNRVMVDRSDLVILYVEHPSGGAYQTFRYVQKSGKKFINLAAEEYFLFRCQKVNILVTSAHYSTSSRPPDARYGGIFVPFPI